MTNNNKISRAALLTELAALEAHPFSATALHVNSIIIEANQEFADMIGYALDAVAGLNAWLLFPPASFNLLMEKIKDNEIETYEVLAHDRTGREFPIQLKAENLSHKGEAARRVFVRDVSRLVEICERLASLEA